MPNVERLKLIQAIIDRMARNSFALKGWAVTLTSALLSLAATRHDPAIAAIAIYVLAAICPASRKCDRLAPLECGDRGAGIGGAGAAQAFPTASIAVPERQSQPGSTVFCGVVVRSGR